MGEGWGTGAGSLARDSSIYANIIARVIYLSHQLPLSKNVSIYAGARPIALTRACRKNGPWASGVKASNSEHTQGNDLPCTDLMTKSAAGHRSRAKGRGVERGKWVGLRGLSLQSLTFDQRKTGLSKKGRLYDG